MDERAFVERAFAALPEEEAAAIDEADRRILEGALRYSMTGIPRMLALLDAVRYVVRRGIEGGLAECGVWRGGSVVAMIEVLKELGVDDRELHLFDTFEGMTEPTGHDTSPLHPPARQMWLESDGRPWPELFNSELFNEERVRETVLATGYPSERIEFVRGPVEETLPAAAPERLALLRLDTDWYESTRHELEHLYPKLESGGVLIVDDYGYWDGCRRAVDEYFAERTPIMLTRIDFTGRIAIKP
jgi:hypothetical protein